MLATLRALRKNAVFDLLFTLAVAIGVAYLVQLWVVKPYRIPTGSMERTFHIGDRILAARFWYDLTSPGRGDIIVFHPNGNGNNAVLSNHVASVTFVKRVIGLPGEWIESQHGKVLICKGPAGRGCRQLNEPYAVGRTGVCGDPNSDLPPQRVPPGQYFVMGDNREASDDSRCWGTIRASQIIGRAFMIYWPPSQISFF